MLFLFFLISVVLSLALVRISLDIVEPLNPDRELMHPVATPAEHHHRRTHARPRYLRCERE